MNWYSQAGQDKWVYEVLGQKKDGNFLDIGCHDGEKHSNTKALELLGWHGLLVDIQHLPKVDERLSYFRQLDAVTADWQAVLNAYFHELQIDYLSLDVDDSTTLVLSKLMALPMRYRVLTVEHDAYKVGPSNAMAQHALLSEHGYQLLCKDVRVGPGEWGAGGAFESWWVCADLMTEDNCRRFLCDNQLGTGIVPDEG